MGATTLWDRLLAASRRQGTGLHCWDGTGFGDSPWSEVAADAADMTAGLRRAGVRPGDRVATVLANTPLAVRGLLAVWLAGGAVASFPAPARGMEPAEYAAQLARLADHLGPAVFAVDAGVAAYLPPELAARARVVTWESLAGSGRVEPAPPGRDEVAFLQYSSGSTSAPKGCALTEAAISAQLDMILDMTGGVPGREVIGSWLPLSHDMGMFGCLLYAWAYGFDLVLSTPERFTYGPRTWFADLARFGVTMTAGTNTALHLAARAHRGRQLAARLRLRVCVIGAERVEWETLRLATEAFAGDGLDGVALMPAYGLAEATLAVTATPADEEPRRVAVDGLRLADGVVADADPADPVATTIVGCGRPCKGVRLAGVSAERMGTLRISSPSLASGYEGDVERTRERFVDGELVTDDLAFVRDGHLYVVGRSDDMIPLGGRNVYAREIETAVDALDGVRHGCSTLLQADGGGRARLVLLTEVRGRPPWRSLAERAAAIAMAKGGVAVDACVFVERGGLPKTPSGKIQRYRCRQLLAAGRLPALETVELATA